jgi:hypothetical protein
MSTPGSLEFQVPIGVTVPTRVLDAARVDGAVVVLIEVGQEEWEMIDLVMYLLPIEDELRSTVNWYALEVTEPVPLPPELAAKGEVRQGFTTTWRAELAGR